LDALDANSSLKQKLRDFGDSLRDVDAVVVVSSHVPANGLNPTGLVVNAGARPPLIYDFESVPEELYALQYPGFGLPDLASRVSRQFISAGIPVRLDSERGWEHLVWMPLREIFPRGNVPVVEIGVALESAPETLFRAGETLSFLRDRGVLLMATAGTTVPEEIDPLFFIAGAARSGDRMTMIHDDILLGGTLESLRLAA
jgi:4,5-DOPA dioxygenase extradiol